jgi:hypothetical protein
MAKNFFENKFDFAKILEFVAHSKYSQYTQKIIFFCGKLDTVYFLLDLVQLQAYSYIPYVVRGAPLKALGNSRCHCTHSQLLGVVANY